MTKRYIQVVIALLISLASANAQGYYPLQVGNIWQFIDDPMHPYLQTESIIADTVLGNGHTYAVYSGQFFYPARFIRQIGTKVVYFNSADSTDNTFLDFAASEGDTISGHSNTHWIALGKKSYNSYYQQNQWSFGYGYGNLEDGGWTIVDSLGLYSVAMEPGIVWNLTGVRIDGLVRYGSITSVSDQQSAVPKSIVIYQNYPNPFNPTTNIQFFLPTRSYVSMRIFDLLGRQVADIYEGSLNSGFHSCSWNAVNVNSGVYFCHLQAGVFIGDRKLILLK